MTRSLGELAGIALRGVALDQVLGLEFDGLSLRVRTNSAALRQRLADYFRAAVAEPATGALDIIAVQASAPEFSLPFTDWQRDPGKAGRKEAFSDVAGGRVVLKVRTGMQFLIGPELRLGVGDCETNDNQIINFVIAQYIRHSLTDGALLCHSAGVAHHGHGLTIAATSGAGKSTLALHLMSRGVTFVSNDRVLISKRNGRHFMHGVPKQPRVNPGTLLNNSDLTQVLHERRLTELRDMPLDALWDLEEKYDVDIERVYGPGRWQLSSPLRALLLLNWSRAQPGPPRFAAVDLTQRSDLLDLIMKSPGPFHMEADGRFATGQEQLDTRSYLAGLRGLTVFEASGGVDFEAGVRFCLDLLDTPA